MKKMLTNQEEKYSNKEIAKFMEYIYYHKGVDIDDSEFGGIYDRKEIFSKIPIETDEYHEADQYYFKELPNPDYRKSSDDKPRWNPDLKTLGWNSINYEKYITDLNYHHSYDWLFPVWVKFRDLRIDYTTNKNNCVKLLRFQEKIEKILTRKDISEIFNELSIAVKWYNQFINKNDCENLEN